MRPRNKPEPGWPEVYISCNNPARPRAFTLIELLVVIAIIAILAAILLPVLNLAKAKAVQAQCLSNYKQLQLCYQMYFDDNNQFLPGNFTSTITTQNWILGAAQTDYNTKNIRTAVIYPYNQQPKLYACPANTYVIVLGLTGLPGPYRDDSGHIITAPTVPQTRTCSIEYSMGGNSSFSLTGPWVINYNSVIFNSYGKATQVRNPSIKIVFDEESEYSLNDGELGMYPIQNGVVNPIWWNLPNNRHSHGSNFSFQDGHCEYHKWLGPILNQPLYQPAVYATGNGTTGNVSDPAGGADPDLAWCEAGGAQGY